MRFICIINFFIHAISLVADLEIILKWSKLWAKNDLWYTQCTWFIQLYYLFVPFEKIFLPLAADKDDKVTHSRNTYTLHIHGETNAHDRIHTKGITKRIVWQWTHSHERGSTIFETSISVFNSTEKYLKINPIAYPLFSVHFRSAKRKTCKAYIYTYEIINTGNIFLQL